MTAGFAPHALPHDLAGGIMSDDIPAAFRADQMVLHVLEIIFRTDIGA